MKLDFAFLCSAASPLYGGGYDCRAAGIGVVEAAAMPHCVREVTLVAGFSAKPGAAVRFHVTVVGPTGPLEKRAVGEGAVWPSGRFVVAWPLAGVVLKAVGRHHVSVSEASPGGKFLGSVPFDVIRPAALK
jgi:hypothetical protein